MEEVIMIERDDYQEMPSKSRSERVMEAKKAFSDSRDDSEQYSTEYSFRLLRFMTAGMLFFILVIAIYNGFSYHGFNKEYIEKCLSDEYYYDMILKWVGKAVTEIISVLNIN